ncbi:MAG: pyridoxamine 5'-phosphate oxidase family protein [Actinobacteria bacterium]|nr:pyridoxamine 5'-phosphate oxidase family protein [Actinomycetota bacterium]
MDDLTKIHRAPHKGNTDPEVAKQIISSAKICHVAISVEGQPFSIPVACAPYGDEILLHGSKASRLFKTLASGAQACLTITHLDALVLARSSFESSMHYRSLMAFGAARELESDEKFSALDLLTEHLFPQRTCELRKSTSQEIAATTILAFPLTQISVKVSAGEPDDVKEDLSSDVWAGFVPIRTMYGEPIAAANLRPGIPVPDYIATWVAG